MFPNLTSLYPQLVHGRDPRTHVSACLPPPHTYPNSGLLPGALPCHMFTKRVSQGSRFSSPHSQDSPKAVVTRSTPPAQPGPPLHPQPSPEDAPPPVTPDFSEAQAGPRPREPGETRTPTRPGARPAPGSGAPTSARPRVPRRSRAPTPAPEAPAPRAPPGAAPRERRGTGRRRTEAAAPTVGDELGRQLPRQLGDPLPLALGAAALDLRLQPRARLPGRHRGLAAGGRRLPPRPAPLGSAPARRARRSGGGGGGRREERPCRPGPEPPPGRAAGGRGRGAAARIGATAGPGGAQDPGGRRRACGGSDEGGGPADPRARRPWRRSRSGRDWGADAKGSLPWRALALRSGGPSLRARLRSCPRAGPFCPGRPPGT